MIPTDILESKSHPSTRRMDSIPHAVPLTEAALYQECGRLLVARHHLTRSQLDHANTQATLMGKSLDDVLLDEQWVSEDTLLDLLSEISGIPHVPLAGFTITPEWIRRVPPATALNYRIIPVAATTECITIATSRIHEATEQDSLQTLLRTRATWVLCKRRDIEEAIKHFYGLGADILKDMSTPVRGNQTEGDPASEAGTPGVARLVQEIIREAIQRNASDIHLEPMENRISLRYRVDGVLVKIPLPPDVARYYKSIVSALKVLAQLNITERRMPHDGRAHITIDGETFDLRVSILPTQFGEAANLRILNRKTALLNLQELGLMEHQLPLLRDVMTRPHGIVLITGPTGSGKTSTLYAALSSIKTDSISVVTIEDPVEYQLDGILQIQAHPKIGLTFAAGLRSVLRHDPNIILIGEIRDTETADIAIKSSLTGHLVFSTLHTNNSAGAIARLVDMGIEPYLVASSLQGIVAQRLVRQICPRCHEEAIIPDSVLQEVTRLFPDYPGAPRFAAGRGCPDCKFTGYQGRRAIFEILMIDRLIRPLVIQRVSSEEIQRVATTAGMETLRQIGWKLALQGITTVEEVLRVTQADGIRMA